MVYKNIMEYQQLPPVSMIIGPPAPAQSPHVQILNNSTSNNVNGGTNNNHQLLTMQPPMLPSMPQNLHLHNQPNQTTNVAINNHHNSQSLPPTTQLLQAIHHNTQQQQQQHQQHNGNGNNPNTNGISEDGNRWTQYQVQQLWRHHAYLNGNVIRAY